MTAGPLANFGSVSGWARRGVTRKVGSAVRPARPIKKKATCAAGEGAGLPAEQEVPSGPLGDFGSVVGMAKCEVARKVGSAIRPARRIKKKASCAAREGAGTPAK